MRSLKKAIAVILTLAMVVAMFAFSASAEATYSMVLEGPEFASVGDTYIVKVRLNDSANQVGGASGLLTVEGADLTKVDINPQLYDYNKTLAAGFEGQDAIDTIINEVSDNNFSFASVANLDGDNPATRVWFILTFKITDANPTFTLDTDFSDRYGTALLADTDDSVLAPASPVADIKLVPNASVAKTKDVKVQALKVDAMFEGGIPEDALEYGMLFCPEQLLDSNGLVIGTDNTNIKVATAANTGAVELYNGYIKMNFTNEESAYLLSGVKIAARAYYKNAEGDYVYSDNSADDVSGGIFSKAIISVAADLIGETDDAAVLAALENLADNGNKQIIFEYLYDNFDEDK